MSSVEPKLRLDLVQGSKDWRKWRKLFRPASLAGVAVGVAPQYWSIRNDYDLRRHLLDGWEPEIDEETESMFEYGHQFEGEVRSWADRRYLGDYQSFQPLCVEYGKYSASYDGIFNATGDSGEVIALEVKCPYSGPGSLIWRLANQPERQYPNRQRVPPQYYYQLVQQASVFPKIDRLIYVVRVEQHGSDHSGETEADFRAIEFDGDELRRDWEYLQGCWDRALEGRAQTGDNIGPLVDDYIRAKNASALAVADEKAAAAALKAVGVGTYAGREGSVKISLYERRGVVDWQSIAKHYAPGDIDTDDFRKPTTHQTRLNIVGSRESDSV